MKFLKSLFITFFLISSLINSFAQTNSSGIIHSINENLSDTQKKEIVKANNFIASGDVFMQEVKSIEIEIFNEKEVIKESSDKKAKKAAEKNVVVLEDEGRVNLINATKTSEKGYDIVFAVYNERLSELKSSTSDEDKSKNAKKAIYDSKFKFADSKSIIDKLTDRDTYDYLSKQVKLATQLRQEGIQLLADAICEYIECKNEEIADNNDENDNISNSNNSNSNNSNSNNSNTSNNSNLNNTSNNNSNNSNSNFSNNNTNNSNFNKSYIYFTVQVMAVSKVLPSVAVDKVYKGNKNVTVTFHEGLWKYLVGRFDDYEDARLFQEGLGGDSFVVAMKDGQRIDIVKAINETKH